MQEQTQDSKEIQTRIIAQAWKDEAYKQELLNNSKSVIEREFNIQLPSDLQVCVMEENASTFYFILPARPNLENVELSEEQLEAVAGGASVGDVFTFVEKTYAELKDFGAEIYRAIF
ncbi:NHLP leader peptide family natural product precursor [Scytonema sp. UIC 10036]|uniref:NHLP leader peptide family RiPP precursor n=1 Tax=Scytonema sp. UIC 10036 TaxID=2304196 RepID=UPI0012DAD946|nr:NHLP leader peptide family RiPP precursor [Scytonema sp. UIC 10036]MUG97845.1 NHLP leader peptide family natural product precursor [Scytonema sp. UIC 10036]